MDKTTPTRSAARGGFALTIAGNTPDDLLERVVKLGARTAPAEVEIVKRNPARTVFRLQHHGNTFYVKWHHHRGLADVLASVLRGTRAAREWRNLNMLRQRELPAIEPVAMGVRQRWGMPLESFLVTAGVAGKDLRQIAGELTDGPPVAAWPLPRASCCEKCTKWA